MPVERYAELVRNLRRHLPAERIFTDPLRTYAFGTDASFYRLTPQVVVKIRDESELLAVLGACRNFSLPLTFRAAGTSLSGQALSDSVLALLDEDGWRQSRVSKNGRRIDLGVGLLGIEANRLLAPHGRKIGPDPASINAAKIGGIVSNNSCGMSSGITENSMGTLAGMRLVLVDGTVLDTRDAASREAFCQKRPDIVEGVVRLAGRLRADPEIEARIARKYRIKNTTGYSVNALLNFSDPIDVIEHLMIGSEGTLGFISEVTFNTVPLARFRAACLMLFPDVARACRAVEILKTCRVTAAELMDRAALASVQDKPGMPPYIRDLDEKTAALLVETDADSAAVLQEQIDAILAGFEGFPKARDFEFTADAQQIAALWKVRQGIFPSACTGRPGGTTVIIEDIAVPLVHLPACLEDLQVLFGRYGYRDTIIWGHVFDGNVHFVLTPDFTDPAELDRYRRFMDEVVSLVIDRYDGSLKAEHGTGRNMAPFVRREWGDAVYEVMCGIKTLFDPDNLLNPGVIINQDPEVHLKDLKPMPLAHGLVDTCTECGFCERSCVSHGLTLSARQRIAVFREMARLGRSGENPRRLAELRREYAYHGERTCAADGLCATTCPVEIDTGKLIKVLREQESGSLAREAAREIGARMDVVTTLARGVLGALDLAHGALGSRRMAMVAQRLHGLSRGRLPLWTPAMPRPAARPPRKRVAGNERVVYLPSCINRTMGPSRNEDLPSLVRVTHALLEKAGFTVVYPAGLDRLCCGMPFASKGLSQAAHERERDMQAALLDASDGGRLPVLCDMSPCLQHMRETLDSRLELFEPIGFTLSYLAPRLHFNKLPDTIAIHTVCSARKMGLEQDFRRLASLCADEVVTPDVNCCGFAGDRGFTVPELNRHGLRRLKQQLPPEVTAGYSTSRTCEIGLTAHSGIPYRSILYLVDEVTQPR
jgi:D-lactate dehydrogenase